MNHTPEANDVVVADPLAIPELEQPKVTLMNFTSNPLETLAWANKIYKGKVYSDFSEMLVKEFGGHDDQDEDGDDCIKYKPEELTKFLDYILKDPTNASLEYIQMVFLIEGASRAFQQQLTRHRLSSFIICSLRVMNVGTFATEGRYTLPSTVKNRRAYHEEMLNIEHAYNEAIKQGENVEDARGLLPLNVHSSISMRIDLKSLIHLLKGRLCLTAQEEARKIGYQFKSEVATKMGTWFGQLLQPPCHAMYGGICTRPNDYCGVPLWLASKAPEKFAAWYKEHNGQPDGSRVPTNTVILPEDIAQIKAHLGAI